MFVWTNWTGSTYSCGMLTHYSNRLHDLSVTNLRCFKDFYVNSFFPYTAKIWNLLSIAYFPLTYNLNNFKSGISRQLLLILSEQLSYIFSFVSSFMPQSHEFLWMEICLEEQTKICKEMKCHVFFIKWFANWN